VICYLRATTIAALRSRCRAASPGEVAARSARLGFACPLGARQEIRHILIVNRRLAQRVHVDSPPFRSPIPAIVADRHIDAMIDEELCRLIVPSDGSLMQNAGRLVGAPVRIDVGSVFQKKIRDPDSCMPMQGRSRMCCAFAGPMKIPEPGRMVDGMMLTETDRIALAEGSAREPPAERLGTLALRSAHAPLLSPPVVKVRSRKITYPRALCGVADSPHYRVTVHSGTFGHAIGR
jgi:hypothetical protein